MIPQDKSLNEDKKKKKKQKGEPRLKIYLKKKIKQPRRKRGRKVGI